MALENEIEEKQKRAQKHQREAAQQAQRAPMARFGGPHHEFERPAGRNREFSRSDACGLPSILAPAGFFLFEAAAADELVSQNPEESNRPIEDFTTGLPEQMGPYKEEKNSDYADHAHRVYLPEKLPVSPTLLGEATAS